MDDNNMKGMEQTTNSTETIRSSDSRYVVQHSRKPSIILSIILVLIGAVATATIMLIFFGDKIITSKNIENSNNIQSQAPENTNQIVSDETAKKDENQKNDNNVTVKEVRKLNLNSNGDFINLLYNKLVVDAYNKPLGYQGGRVTYNDIRENDKVLYVLQNIRGKNINYGQVVNKITNYSSGYIKQIDYEEAQRVYKSYYGSDKELPRVSVNTGMGYIYEWVETDNKFYGHEYAGGGGSSYQYYKKIIKCETNDERTEVYIYDKFIYTNEDVNKENELKGRIDSEGVMYKHTFKLDEDGNYYWYSSEIAN